MNIWIAAAAIGLALAAPAAAQTRCQTDAAGRTMCRSADGAWIHGETDANGNSVWRDNRGNTGVGRQTSTGDEVYRDSYGNTVVGHTDPSGNIVLRGNDGAVAVGRSYDAPAGPPPIVGPMHCRTYNHGLSTCP